MISTILRKNKANPEVVIDIAGAALGNPWLDPFNQVFYKSEALVIASHIFVGVV
jgi:hypothetical protein